MVAHLMFLVELKDNICAAFQQMARISNYWRTDVARALRATKRDDADLHELQHYLSMVKHYDGKIEMVCRPGL